MKLTWKTVVAVVGLCIVCAGKTAPADVITKQFNGQNWVLIAGFRAWAEETVADVDNGLRGLFTNSQGAALTTFSDIFATRNTNGMHYSHPDAWGTPIRGYLLEGYESNGVSRNIQGIIYTTEHAWTNLGATVILPNIANAFSPTGMALFNAGGAITPTYSYVLASSGASTPLAFSDDSGDFIMLGVTDGSQGSGDTFDTTFNSAANAVGIGLSDGSGPGYTVRDNFTVRGNAMTITTISTNNGFGGTGSHSGKNQTGWVMVWGLADSSSAIAIKGTNGVALVNNAVATAAAGTDYGKIPWNAARTNTFAVTNSGGTVLTIASWITNGAGAAAFSVFGLPFTVSAGSQSNFTVVFNPLGAGSYSASLSISNNSGTSPFVVNFAGSAYAFSTNNGPLAGGNTMLITNGILGSGSDITNIVVGGVSTTNIAAQGENWVMFVMPAATTSGVKTVVIQSDTVGNTTFANAYTYNPAGAIATGTGEGGQWRSLGSKNVPGQINAVGMQNTVYGLSMGHDGYLYAAGAFTNAGGSNCSRVARFNGTNWLEMAGGIRQFANANVMYASTNGPVYAGGYFTNIGSANSKAVARWTGTNWTAMQMGLYFSQYVNGYVNALVEDRNGDIIAGGYFTNCSPSIPSTRPGVHFVAKWRTQAGVWTNMSQGFNNVVNQLAAGPDGSVYAGGSFTSCYPSGSSRDINYIARWTGTGWTNMAHGFGNRVTCLAVSTNNELYVGGWFTNAINTAGQNVGMRFIARWDGNNWTNVGGGFNNWVYALACGEDGAVYAGGSFTNANAYGATPALGTMRIAKWDGSNWSQMGSGFNDSVLSSVWDMNTHSLIAGGFFKLAGGSSCWYVARWAPSGDAGIIPSSGSWTGGYSVVIKGSNLGNGDVTNVTLCGVSVAGIVSQSATQIVVTAGVADPGSIGLGAVRVYSVSYGEIVSEEAFTYEGPGFRILGTNGAFITSGEAASLAKGTDFGLVTWQTAVTNTFCITNSGNSTLNISGVTTSGTGAAAFRLTPIASSILPGTATTFKVVFAPTALQTYTAVVAIANNSSISPVLLNLSGEGSKRLQTITFPAIGQQITTNLTLLTASASSGLAVSFAVVSGPASLSGLTSLTYTASGAVAVRATQGGDADYAAAIPVTNTFNVIKAAQAAVIFNPGAYLPYRTTNILSASGGSGTGTFSFAIASGGAKIENGNELIGNAGTGDVIVVATRASDDLYLQGAATARVSMVKAQQAALVFNPTSPQGYGTTNTLTTTGGSSLGAVTYAVLAGPGVIVEGNKLSVTGGVGQVTVRATKAGDECYFSIAATGTVLVGKATQTITFPPVSDQFWTNIVGLAATADSGLSVSFSVLPPSPAVLSGGTNLSFNRLGEVSVVASQGGNSMYEAADPVTNSFQVLGPDPLWLDAYGAVLTNNQDVAVTNGTDFGAVYTFSAATNRFSITNAGSTAWIPQSVATNGSDAFALIQFPTSILANATADFYVVFSPVVAGAQTAELVVADNAIGSPFTLNVVGAAAEPRIALLGTNGAEVLNGEAASIAKGTDFGTLRLGESATHRLWLTNAGNATLTTTWTTNGADAAQFSFEPPESVLSQRSFELLVDYAPDAVGVQTAAVVIANNSTNTPFVLCLAGTVIDPQIALVGADGMTYPDDTAPDTAIGTDFGMVVTGANTFVTLAITNKGQSTLSISGYGVSGSGADAFSVSNLPATVESGTASNLLLYYQPGSLGAHSLVLSLTNSSTATVFRINAAGLGVKAGEIGINRAKINFSAVYGGANPPEEVYAQDNVGALAYTYTNEVSYDSGASGWLTLSIYTGTLAGSAVQSTTGSVDITGLGVGTYIATNTITSSDATNAPIDMLFMLTIEKAAQTINFPALSDQVTTNSVGLAATSSASLPVSFAVYSGPAQIASGTNLTFTGAGTVRIVASQAGNANYAAAPSVTNSLTVSKAEQATVVFVPTNNPQSYGSSQTLVASGGSGSGTFSYEYLGGPGKVAGDILYLTSGTGSVTVKATRAEDDYYNSGSATAVVVCAQASQTINFTNPGAQFTTNTTTLSATASSGLTVTFAVVSGPGSLAGSTLTYTGAGTMEIRASQTGDLNYAAAVDVTQSFAVAKSTQDAVVFDPLTPQTYGTTNTLAAFGGSGTGGFYYAVSQGDGLIVEGNKLTLTSATGTVVVTATKADDDLYSEMSAVSTVVCAKITQTITFPPIQDQLATNVTPLEASASSGLAVTFEVMSGPAGLTGLSNLTYTGSGEVTVRALQNGNEYYEAAVAVTNLFQVGKAAQADMLFSPASPQVYGTTNGLSATGGSGTGVVSYAVAEGAGAIVDSTNLTITAGTGSVFVVANKAADDLYNGMAVTATVVCVRDTQTITFAQIPAQSSTNRLGLSATASSGLAVSFSVLAGPAILADGTNLSFNTTGTVSMVASQAGDDNFFAAPEVTNTFDVGLATQEPLEFDPGSPHTYGESFALSASGGSTEGAIVFAIVSGGAQFIEGSETWIEITSGTGSVVVTATKAGDEMYSSIVATATMVCAKAAQSITFDQIPDQNWTNRLGLSAVASSGLEVLFRIDSGLATLTSGTNVSFSGNGPVSITAYQDGNSNYDSNFLTRSFTVVGPQVTLLGTNGAALVNSNETTKADGTDFDHVPIGVPVAHVFSVTNSGTDLLSISAWTTNGGGAATYVVSDWPATVDVGGVSNFVVTFTPAALGVVTAQMVIVNDSPMTPYILNLSGSGCLLSTNVGPYAGGNTITITNGDFGAITNVLVDGLQATIQASGTNWVRITIPSAGSAGAKDIVIQTSDYGDSTMLGAYAYNEAGVIYTNTPTGGSWTGGYQVVISGTNLCNGGDITNVTVCGAAAMLVSQSATQVIVQVGAGSGAVTGDVWVFSTSYGVTIKSNAFTYAVEPQIAVLGINGASIDNGEAASTAKGTDFGLVRVGVTAVNNFSITNSGDYRVVISGVTTSGTGEAVFEVRNMPAAVMQNTRSNFAVAYTPAALGTYTATVGIAHSATGTPYVVYVEGISYETTTNSGSSDGGNTLILTNGVPFGTNITNVVVCGIRATIVTQGVDWVEIRLGSGGNGTGDIVLQLETGTPLVYPNAYTYIYSGGGGGGEEVPTTPSGADFKVKQTLITPKKPSCGGKFIVWAQVENKGTVKADAGYLSLMVDGKLFGAVKVGTLDKKKTKVVKFTNVKSAKKYTPIVLTLKVDCYNVTKETNETNNTTTKNVACK